MFELVLHHDYATETAQDLSGNDNHGRISHLSLVEGMRPSTAALGFDGYTDRVVVFPSESLNDLKALRISAWIWVQELGQRRNLLEGFVSFAMMIEEDGTLQCKVYDGTRWDGVWTPPNTIPVQEWIQVHFVYDGDETAALYVNDHLVAKRYWHLGHVHSIAWPYGLNIGAWPDADRYVFAGKIATLKVWRAAR
jgi:hypothetical protein